MGKKILMFDDDAEIKFLCGEILTRNGIELVTADNAADALEIAIEEKPDLILMDIWLPNSGGEAAAERIKNNEQSYEIPIVFFSANADTDVITTKVGARGYIKKPFEITDFINKVKAYML